MNELNKIINQMLNEASYLDMQWKDTCAFPKYRITQTSDYTYTLELALAGYDKKDIKVSSIKNKLSISCKVDTSKYANKKDDNKYPKIIENHIAERDFEKVWTTNEQYNINVSNVSMKDGMLKVDVEIEVPETWKEKVYTIK